MALQRAEGGTVTRSHETRLGGQPMVDPTFAWPWSAGRPFSLLAVLNLATLPSEPALGDLPDRGYLNIFVDVDAPLAGVAPEALTGVVVTHAKGGVYEQRPTPSGAQQTVAVPLEAVAQLSLPHPSEPAIAASLASLSPDIGDTPATSLEAKLAKAWAQMLEAVGAPRHRLLGWPDLLGGPLDPLPTLRGGAAWTLLAQLDSDDELEWSWGNVGRLYVMIPDRDIAKGRFDRCQVRIQSY
jgi:hypothetical protein